MLWRLFNMLRGGAPDNGDGTFTITHRGRAFRFPIPEGPDLLLNRVRQRGSFYEPDLLAACVQAVTGRDGLCLDIGANVGNHSLYLAGVLGRTVMSFEPVPANLHLLRRLMELNPEAAKNVTIVPKALSDAPATLWMSKYDPNNPGTYSVGDASDEAQEVEALRLDDHLEAVGLADASIAMMKIDVEGHEAAVLAGAARTLERNDCVLTLEASNTAEFDEISTQLSPYGFAPVSVHCSTPTVIFAKGASNAAHDEIRSHIAKHERKGKSR